MMSYANRGMTFEKAIDQQNFIYLSKGQAVIHKKPTPIRQVGTVKFGRFPAVRYKASTTDYNGVFNGRYVDFEAKRTNNKTSLPLSMIQEHQYEHLRQIVKQNGIGFILVNFNKLKQSYLLPFEALQEFWENAKGDGRKSIPIDTFKVEAYEVDDYADYLPALKMYIEALDKLD